MITMPANAQAMGLCSTCNNSPTCFHRARRGPALFCEMFDDGTAPVGRNGNHVLRSADPPPDPPAALEDAGKYAGLCINCEHRGSCAHPKPAGGVWHCEDYE